MKSCSSGDRFRSFSPGSNLEPQEDPYKSLIAPRRPLKALALVRRSPSPRGRSGLSCLGLGSCGPVASPLGDLHSDLALLSALNSETAASSLLGLRVRHWLSVTRAALPSAA